MTAGTDIPLHLSNDIWNSTEMISAVSARDISQIFRIVQRETRASQTQIGIATALSQAQVSEIMSGTRKVSSIDVLGRIMEGLQMPPRTRMILMLGRSQGIQPITEIGADLLESDAPPNATPRLTGTAKDAIAAFTSRSEFGARYPTHRIFDGADTIRAAGISLNLLCQQYADNRLLNLIQRGATVHCLFLDPAGKAIEILEREDGFAAGQLSALTEINIQNILVRIRSRLPDDIRERLQVAIYDETPRANLLFVGAEVCIVQHYLPQMRGIDSPTLLVDRQHSGGELYGVYDQMFKSLWERGRII
ncbi:DUF5919 domain-containing protein [Polymorphospora rubra]|uniref:DUF5919 domain-containing protein n=1 Tax=Polymorphospora rubra TaxID=338584 RepID=UPI00340F81E6